jgi:hypothetical protein
VSDEINLIDTLLSRLDALERRAGIEPVDSVSTLALPPHVASGELITSAWGNAVVDEQVRLRTETWANFSHPGATVTLYGIYDCGQTNLGPFAYPVQVMVCWNTEIGWAQHNVWGGADLVRLYDGVVGIVVGNVLAVGADGGGGTQSSLANISLMYAYDVAAGQPAGFRTRAHFDATTATPISFLFRSAGTYFVKRTDTT